MNTASVEDFPPTLNHYEKMAAVWDEYGATFVPSYTPFLLAAGEYYRQPLRTVLDLACGTGLLTRKLAEQTDAVVGLDVSEAMLKEARARTTAGNIHYVRADFRDFHLGQTFDAVLCSSDSLNYIHAPADLGRVFCCVQRHLQPGGLFLFDVLDHWAFCQLAVRKSVARVRGIDFEIYHFYDLESGVSEARVVIDGAVERHPRIAIEEEHVGQAAYQTGLQIKVCFGLARRYYVLRRPPHKSR